MYKDLDRRIPDTLRAAAILAFVIILVYGEVCFLGYTLSPAVRNQGVLNGFQYGYEGREPYNLYVMDPLATGGQNWPIYALISRTLISGHAPLWNPYQGVGTPLAADTTWDAYYPLNILYAIPNQYWDFVWFIKLWLAGMLCYLLLKDLQLDFIPSLGGAFAYCLSGALIFHPLMPWSDVAVFTPALLLAAKRCFDKPLSADSLSVGSILVAASILGAHIEALVIQFLFIGLFVLFQVIAIRKMGRGRGILTWIGTVSIGFGLAAFFLFPVFEYLTLAALGHSGDVGVHSLSTDGNPATWLLTLFVPYFFGPLQTYPYQGLRQAFFWDISPGYMGTSVFFLASVALFSLRNLKKSERRYDQRYVVFFITASFLILLKIFGVPPVNWIGYLPVLSHVIFPRYSGSVLAASFSGACAFGLQTISDRTASTRSLRNGLLLPLLTITFAVLPCIPVLASPPVAIVPWLPFPLFLGSFAYLVLSLTFLLLAYVVAVSRTIYPTKPLATLIILELVCYVPMSLPLGYEVGRVGICTAAAILVVLYVRGSTRHVLSVMALPTPTSKGTSRDHVFATVLVIALLVQSGVAGVSPGGLPARFDAFSKAPYLAFLEKNVGNQRVYSLDGALFAPVAGVFSIQHLGEFSAFMPYSFRKFSLQDLDSGAMSASLVGNAWFRQGNSSALSQVRQNIAFYSLLGAKYFVTAYTDLSLANAFFIESDVAWWESPWESLGDKSFSAFLTTDRPFDSIYVRMVTLDDAGGGTVRLALDKIPYDPHLHREAHISARSVTSRSPVEFTFVRVEIVQRTEFKITLVQSDFERGGEVGIVIWPQVRQNPHFTVFGSFQTDGEASNGYAALGLGLHEQFLPIVYRDQDVTIYENPMAFSRAFLVSDLSVVENEEQALIETNKLGWNTRNVLVLEETPPAEELQLVRAVDSHAPTATVEIEGYSPNEAVISVDTSNPSFLVLTDLYYPGWKSYVDDSPTTMYRAYGLVRAIFVDQGSHRIVFRYEPDSFRIGTTISLLSAGCIFLLFVQDRATRLVRRKAAYGSMNRKP